MNTIMKIMKNDTEEKNDSSFSYPANEDIYNKSINEADKIPEINSFQKSNNKDITDLKQNEDGIFENDLDVPGSELDDQLEKIGSEDEENNYYSIGGDRHDDLEEDKSE